MSIETVSFNKVRKKNMTLPIITGLNKSEISKLLLSKSSFEIIGLRGSFTATINFVEKEIESHGLKCRVKVDIKGAIAQGGVLGTVIGVASLPAGVALAAAATVASAGHALATYNPDYEIIKDYVNKKLKVIYKR
ncbi:hypothetical protein [Pseudomonas lactis]|uniref:Uncharacterized protein n=1 Tax=Pseudomonas lactis TaxID=1615674 RepID=I4K516_9PSED|nr:hypothetical protein [Pseudomonas lactis]EIK59806.1 hypothetical protein PflSS101_1486 [Pseudomonas lactis]